MPHGGGNISTAEGYLESPILLLLLSIQPLSCNCFKVESYVVALLSLLVWPLPIDIKTSSDHWPRISSKRLSIHVRIRKHKWALTTWLSCFDHADIFELDHFDQDFLSYFLWLKVNMETVLEASILEYDRYSKVNVTGTLNSDRT